MAAIEALDPSAVRRWCAAAVDALEARRGEIDDLNVYPVPDGDTGTNLLLTLRAADEAVRGGPPADVAGTLGAMARGAVLGARGNSGVILSQLLRGLAEGIGPVAGGRAVAAGLTKGAELAWGAVGEPVEGTMLSVARGAAEAACAAGDALPDVVSAAVTGAVAALERTPSQLAALARAGVVDAGGRGFVVLLEALAGVVGGASPPARTARLARDPGALEATRESGSDDYAYEVQYLLDAADGAVATLREELAGLGDSLVVVGTGEGRWTVHVHVNDVGAAIEAGIEAGRPHRVTVTRFADALVAAGGTRDGVAVVALAPGAGVADLFAAEGVVVVPEPLGVAEVAAAVAGTAAAAVVILPCSATATAVADAAAVSGRELGVDVAVVPTRSAVQGLAAVAVHDESRRFPDDVIAMAEAAAATRSAEVVVAARDALTMAGPCRAGDVLGLAEGDVVLIGTTVAGVAGDLLDRMLSGGGELVTLLLGTGTAPDLAAVLERRVAADHPGVEVTAYAGGQPVPVLIGVE